MTQNSTEVTAVMAVVKLLVEAVAQLRAACLTLWDQQHQAHFAASQSVPNGPVDYCFPFSPLKLLDGLAGTLLAPGLQSIRASSSPVKL